MCFFCFLFCYLTSCGGLSICVNSQTIRGNIILTTYCTLHCRMHINSSCFSDHSVTSIYSFINIIKNYTSTYIGFSTSIHAFHTMEQQDALVQNTQYVQNKNISQSSWAHVWVCLKWSVVEHVFEHWLLSYILHHEPLCICYSLEWYQIWFILETWY